MEAEVVRIFLALLRFDFSTQSVHKSHESFNYYTKKIKYAADPLLRQYLANCKVSKMELIIARDTLIFLLQNLGFLINFKKAILQSCQRIEVLEIAMDSRDMTLTLPQEKVNAIID